MTKQSTIVAENVGIVQATQPIENLIFEIRGHQVMLDRDLAMLYGVTTSRMNEQVKRNIARFPESFRFQLTAAERDEVIAKCDNLQKMKYNPSLPYAFTEPGVAQLSSVLHSPTAIEVSVRIMEAFVVMRQFLIRNASIFQRLESLEHHQLTTDQRLDEVFRRLEAGQQPKQGIFFDGQIFDAYHFVCDLVRTAKDRIVLFDNYIDDSVLILLDKRNDNVSATIFTKNITPQLTLDIQRHNAQYAPIDILELNKVHDRFLCIDDTVYHIGASLKDLGKKWFAFAKMEINTQQLVCNI